MNMRSFLFKASPQLSALLHKYGILLVCIRLNVIPLHSSISAEQQYKVFLQPEVGKRKVRS